MLFDSEGYVKVNTTRFGELQVNKEDIITFSEGVLGFEKLKQFFVVDPGDSTLILWMQSIEDSEIAFPIIEPKIFKPDYVAKLLPADMASVDLEALSDAKIYSILTIPSNITEMSANLKAPIVINNKKKVAKQIVLQDSKLSVKYEMYKDLKSYIVSYSSDDSKRTTVAEPQTISAKEETNVETTVSPKRENRNEA
ncbi:MAG: flagellar assembly protein FliW [Halobacteriovoraceae bacterium]|nr:flagellar assembly protein FliW [Peredibacter sp.]MBJ00450.1 flagellar assembly protein FliW [Halobacteriovoraceae bacterium]